MTSTPHHSAHVPGRRRGPRPGRGVLQGRPQVGPGGRLGRPHRPAAGPQLVRVHRHHRRRPGGHRRPVLRARRAPSVDYSEDYSDNQFGLAEVFGPTLFEGKPTGYDIVVPTYWVVSQLLERGLLNEIPLEHVPNHVNVDPALLGTAWDRGARFHMPWQAGITGSPTTPPSPGATWAPSPTSSTPGSRAGWGWCRRCGRWWGCSCWPGATTPAGPPSPPPTPPSTGWRTWSRRARSPASPATSTSTPWRAASSPPAWPGRATWSSSRPAGPTSAS